MRYLENMEKHRNMMRQKGNGGNYYNIKSRLLVEFFCLIFEKEFH